MFILPQLPYAYNALEPYMDEQTLRIHYGKHHQTYVSNLNEVIKGYKDLSDKDLDELLRNLENVPKEILVKLKRNAGQHYNHSLFWKILGPKGIGEPKGYVQKAIDKKFGSFLKFQEEFSNKALTRFGSGWIWLAIKGGEIELSDSQNEENPQMEGKKPFFVLDVWEHAYYLKYQNRRSEYIKAFWNIINWPEVENLYKKALNG